MAPALLGPPEIPLPTTASASTTTVVATAKPPIGFTENGSATFMATGNPCLDFFFHVVPDTLSEQLIQRLELAWDHHPLITLKLICNLRGVRGTGKSDKKGFYTAAMWLHKHHPKTLACNVKAVADFGYFKDMLEILYKLLNGPTVRETEEKEWKRRKRALKPQKPGRKMMIKAIEDEEKVKSLRLVKTVEKTKKALDRYNHDPDYRFLHERVSDFFTEILRSDMKFYNAGEIKDISLAAKWCPSLDSSYDKATLMCESIARKVFPREEYVEYQEIEEAHYAYRVRDRLRKEVLVPLRAALKIPEVYMSAKKWDKIPYNRVASVAMKIYKKLFYKHDKERFEEYLKKVKSGKSTIAAGALLPHEIIASLYDENGEEVAELQWKRMVDDVAKLGKLTNCMAICDVSGSMSGIPMEVSVALGLLISELSEEPWKGKLITFSANPQLHIIRGDTLTSKTQFIREMDWGMNTDFQKVFDRILEVATRGNLSEDKMIKKVFVFSDMEFDQASASKRSRASFYSGMGAGFKTSGWDTDYEVIKRKFAEKGYEKVPEIVFWNLRDSRATPVPSDQPGVALVSGFSKNMVKMFLEEGEIESPEAVMLKAISGDEYHELVVLD